MSIFAHNKNAPPFHNESAPQNFLNNHEKTNLTLRQGFA